MSEEKVEKNEIGFFISIQKQSLISGELIAINTNLPVGSTSEEIKNMIKLITDAIDSRIPANQGMVDQAMMEKMLTQGQNDPAN